jgi:hypothetical protein
MVHAAIATAPDIAKENRAIDGKNSGASTGSKSAIVGTVLIKHSIPNLSAEKGLDRTAISLWTRAEMRTSTPLVDESEQTLKVEICLVCSQTNEFN